MLIILWKNTTYENIKLGDLLIDLIDRNGTD